MITPSMALVGLGTYFALVFAFALLWRKRERRQKAIATVRRASGGDYDNRKSYEAAEAGTFRMQS
jgi:hypothetical protein